MKSTDPNTQKQYIIPDPVDDRERIDAFVAENRDKKIVVIQGLGFVGAVMSIVVANSFQDEYAVIGVDLPHGDSYWKIPAINEGNFPIASSDPKVEEYFQNALKKGTLLATADPYAYTLAEIIVVDVNLDVAKKEGTDFEVELTPLKMAIRTAAERCPEHALFLIETTVPPGTCERVIEPLLKKIYQERGLAPEYKLAHSYERVMPGSKYVDSIRDFYRVFAGIDEESTEAAEKFLNGIIHTDRHPLSKLHSTTASELGKVLENSYRAMNIAFIQEWTEFSEEAGVDLYEVVQAIRKRPTHRNIMLPGLGVGGYCLTKDPLLASWARQHLFGGKGPLPQSEAAVRINDRMPLHSFHHLKSRFDKLEGKKVLLLGVSYLSDIGDTRYTPVGPLYEALKDEGCQLLLHDPYVPYWREKDEKVEQELKLLLSENPDIIVLSTAHSAYKEPPATELLKRSEDRYILDAWGAFPKELLQRLKEKNEVEVIGNGTLSKAT